MRSRLSADANESKPGEVNEAGQDAAAFFCQSTDSRVLVPFAPLQVNVVVPDRNGFIRFLDLPRENGDAAQRSSVFPAVTRPDIVPPLFKRMFIGPDVALVFSIQKCAWPIPLKYKRHSPGLS